MHPPDPALLVPRPKDARASGASFLMPATLRARLAGIAADDPALERLRARLWRTGATLRWVEHGPAELELALDDEASDHVEGYRLDVDGDGFRARAPRAVGLVHALRTLEQWLCLHGPNAHAIAALSVDDRPDLAERGVMLDVSRDRVPRMDELFARVERFAALKLNRLQLYFEASFAYRDHERVWADASPFTADELRALDAFCRARHVELVPNQQSFGHLHKWLKHEPYRALAECPEGVEHPFSSEPEPFSLGATDPRALAFLEERYDELLPCFSSATLNVGLDETFDLGLGRSRAECAARGRHRVYVDYLRAVDERVRARGRTTQFWGDIVLEQPDVIPDLPPTAVAMVWGYEASHPFEQQLAAFAASGLAFQVCPGTSSWNSLGGRVDNALANIANAARAGHAAGAAGLLATDWGDRGHLQPAPISEPGWIAAAEHAWNAERAVALSGAEVATRLDAFTFEDPARRLGAAIVALGRIDAAGARATNGTALFYLLAFGLEALPHARIEALTLAGLDHAEERIELALAPLAEAHAERADARRVVDELNWTGDALRCACALGRARLAAGKRNMLGELSVDVRTPLAREVQTLVERHRELWLRRSRPGGLARSAHWLERLGAALGS